MSRKEKAVKKDNRQVLWLIILVVVGVLGSALYSIKHNIRCDRKFDPVNSTRVECR